MSSLHYLKVVVYFLILTELIRFSVEVLYCEVFKFLGKDLMDFGIRSGKNCRHPGNGGPQTCLPAAHGAAPPAALYGPSSPTNTQDPHEGPSLAR